MSPTLCVRRVTDRHPHRAIRSTSANAPTRERYCRSPVRRGRRPDAAGDRRRPTIREANVPQYMLLIFSDPSPGPGRGARPRRWPCGRRGAATRRPERTPASSSAASRWRPRRRRRPSVCATARASSPTGRSRRPRRSSAATTSSTSPTSTAPWPGQADAQHPLRLGRGPALMEFDPGVSSAVERAFREEGRRVLASLIRHLRRLPAGRGRPAGRLRRRGTTWPRDGVPGNSGAWLTVAARRKAIDRLRRGRALRTRACPPCRTRWSRRHDEGAAP